MRTPTAGQRAAAAQQVVAGMVEPTVRVSVLVDRVFVDDHRRPNVPGVHPATALVSVEMVGPEVSLGRTQKDIIVSREARAWCNDEILNAARRAAERIMRKHPGWRRRRDASAATLLA